MSRIHCSSRLSTRLYKKCYGIYIFSDVSACKVSNYLVEKWRNLRSNRRLSGKLWYLQHICVGDTVVYHSPSDMSCLETSLIVVLNSLCLARIGCRVSYTCPFLSINQVCNIWYQTITHVNVMQICFLKNVAYYVFRNLILLCVASLALKRSWDCHSAREIII